MNKFNHIYGYINASHEWNKSYVNDNKIIKILKIVNYNNFRI